MNAKRFCLLLGVCYILALGIGWGPAAAGFIDFDSITPPGSSPLTIGGVTFSGGVLNNSLNSLTPPNVYARPFSLTEFAAGFNSIPIFTMSFDKPVFGVSFHLLDAGVRGINPLFSNLILGNFNVQSFDPTGKLLDSDSVSAGLLDLGFNRFELFSDGIKTLTLSAVVNNMNPIVDELGIVNAAIDNFFFERCCTSDSLVPLPSSILLFGSGLLGLVPFWRLCRRM